MGASSSIMQELREDSSIQGRRVSHQPRRWDEWCVVSDVPLRRWGRGRGPWGRGQRGITEPHAGGACSRLRIDIICLAQRGSCDSLLHALDRSMLYSKFGQPSRQDHPAFRWKCWPAQVAQGMEEGRFVRGQAAG